jgi:hypothetical protein
MALTNARAASHSASWASLLGGVGAVLLPKCPLCFAAYGSALGAAGVGPLAQERLVDGLLVLAVAVSCGLVWQLSLRRHDVWTPLASATGGLLLLTGQLAFGARPLTLLGAVLLVAAALVNAGRCRRAARG